MHPVSDKPIYNFNSIKVQLKLSEVEKTSEMSTFQFHKGTIKTCLELVTIPPLVLNFNSIKVQLKPSIFKQLDDTFKFQFHKGTIKTVRK